MFSDWLLLKHVTCVLGADWNKLRISYSIGDSKNHTIS